MEVRVEEFVHGLGITYQETLKCTPEELEALREILNKYRKVREEHPPAPAIVKEYRLRVLS